MYFTKMVVTGLKYTHLPHLLHANSLPRGIICCQSSFNKYVYIASMNCDFQCQITFIWPDVLSGALK